MHIEVGQKPVCEHRLSELTELGINNISYIKSSVKQATKKEINHFRLFVTILNQVDSPGCCNPDGTLAGGLQGSRGYPRSYVSFQEDLSSKDYGKLLSKACSCVLEKWKPVVPCCSCF